MRFSEAFQLESRISALKNQIPPKRRLWVCGGPGCLAAGAARVYEELKKELIFANFGASSDYKANLTGCLGLCERGPLIEVEPENFFYENVKVQDVSDIANETLIRGNLLDRLVKNPQRPGKDSHPFYKSQKRIIMRRFGRIDPENFDDYLLTQGYEAFLLAVSKLGRDETLRRVEDSGLRGRGGGGFPAGRKWRALKESSVKPRYILANGDEGDPGAFMNRALMEGDPLSIIEGMTIAAFALECEKGFIYVRHEYPLSVYRLNLAINTAREHGLLGKNILGLGMDFELEIVEGGGAFVCGESTALMASIEGKEGLPRVKYVRSTEAGLWEKPTLLQNVESWANIPLIVKNGPKWFKSMGTEKNPGTKVFSLVGQVKNTGLVELPLGTSLETVVEEAGGGVRPGRVFKAVQSGGPSGGCLPQSLLNLTLDFDSLTKAHSMMGSGGLIVMDDLSCMVDVARYFTGFLVEESCGKCAPCREGLPLMLQILNALVSGQGQRGDTEILEKYAKNLSATALCGLGQSAANPILSTIMYFRDEYLEHERGFCRSGRCHNLYIPFIISDNCTGCGLCKKACPASAIEGKNKKPHKILNKKCITCGACLSACRFKAVVAKERENA